MERILLKYRDEILQPSLCLSTHILEERVKILETYPKSEKNLSFYPQFSCICMFSKELAIALSRTILVMTLYNLNLAY